MSKQPSERAADSDARHREVTNKDVEIFDAGIASQEAFYRNMWTIRTMLKEVGNLDQRHRSLKEAIAVIEQQCAQVNAQLEGVKTELTKVQQQTVEKRQELAELTAAAEEKRRELEAYSQSIDRIMGKVAA